MRSTDFDIAIVGCGPVGALAGNLLGRRGLRVAILEREIAVHGIPRAFSCDDEALRIYQQADLADALLGDMIQCEEAEFVGEDGQPFAVIRFADLDFGSGYGAWNFFHQPDLEATLRLGLLRFDCVSLRLGHQVVAMQQDRNGVSLSVRVDDTNDSYLLRAQWVLGCDGYRSTSRRLTGIELSGPHYAEPWIAISGTVETPPVTMPKVRFVCAHSRPAFIARGPKGHCRFEFMLREDETAEEMERPESVAQLISPYVDPSEIRIERASVYTFDRKIASRFRAGRFFLLGDAAHTMPPFLGQGLVSGLRDASNLEWKLAFVIRGIAGESLLDTYEIERRPHVQAMAEISARIGHVFLVRDPRLAAIRDAIFRAAARVPRLQRFIRDGEFKPRTVFQTGLMMGGTRKRDDPQGTLFPQPFVQDSKGRRLRLDDVLGPGFAVLGMERDPIEWIPSQSKDIFRDLDARLIEVLPAGKGSAAREGKIVDVEGKLAAWFARYGVEIAVIRPDHFVFGAGHAFEIESIGRALRVMLEH